MSDELVPASDLPDEHLSGQEVPPEDLPAQSGDEVPAHDLPEAALQQQNATPGQQALTGIESLGRGITGGLSDSLASGMRNVASHLGVPDEDLHYIAPDKQNIQARQEANPIESGVGEALGNVGTMMALPQAEFARLGQVGSKAVTMALQMGAFGAADEFSKTMLGQGNPSDAAAWNIAKKGALGLVGGAIAGKLEGLVPKVLENAKLGSKFKSLLAGMGRSATLPEEDVIPLAKSGFLDKNLSDTWFKNGQHLYKSLPSMVTGTVVGHLTGSYSEGALAGVAEKMLDKYVSPLTSKISQKYAAPILLKAASSGAVDNLTQALDHAASALAGKKMIGNAVESLFKVGGGNAVDYLDSTKAEAARDKLKDWISNGGVNTQIQQTATTPEPQQAFAEGGEVNPPLDVSENDPVSKVWPEQNVLLSAAKARVSNYLLSQKPQTQNALPYDSERKDPVKEKKYHNTLDLANHPLTIMNHIKDGTLLPSQVNDLKQMYPELHEHLSKKITQRVMEGKLKEEKKPSYHVRQAMSLFLGANLDSSLSPQNMMAAQNVFIQQNAQKAQAKVGALNKAAENNVTPGQAREKALTKT